MALSLKSVWHAGITFASKTMYVVWSSEQNTVVFDITVFKAILNGVIFEWSAKDIQQKTKLKIKYNVPQPP